MIDEIKDYISEIDPNIILFDGLDSALIGFQEAFGKKPVAIYDYDLCIRLLEDGGEPDLEKRYFDACEYFEFNVLGAYVGDYTPTFLRRPEGRAGHTVRLNESKTLWDEMDEAHRTAMVEYIKESYCTKCMSNKSRCRCSER